LRPSAGRESEARAAIADRHVVAAGWPWSQAGDEVARYLDGAVNHDVGRALGWAARLPDRSAAAAHPFARGLDGVGGRALAGPSADGLVEVPLWHPVAKPAAAIQLYFGLNE
jgi:hypothetical protein